MRNLVTELEVIVFGGIEPLRGEKKRRRQERKQELERNVNDGESARMRLKSISWMAPGYRA